MGGETQREFPTIILMLDRIRRVSMDEARHVVRIEFGDDAAATVRHLGENSAGMSYIDWRLGATP
ncbi:MAG TPA: hypothetical protein VMV81_06600, partial [Phycisphaerae bacterium]|nr:hypothetical protein [Phycisphaerae bacterium]